MKDVLLSNAGVQVYIIDGSRRTDGAARAVITALYKAGRICKEAAERAWSDRATLDKIKKYMVHCKMETRATETGDRWTFYTKTGVFMDIEAYSRNYITADADGNLYPAEAPTEPENSEGKEDTTTTKTEPQEATESAEKTAGDTTPTAVDTEPQRATETAQKAAGGKSITTTTETTQEGAQTAGTSEGAETTTTPNTEPPRAATGGSVSQSDRRTRPAAQQSHETTKGIQRHHRPPKTAYRATQSAAHIPAADRRRVATSRGSPKICISWG